MIQIFISHSHADKAVADALKTLFVGVFNEAYVSVRYSSDQSVGGGIEAGAAWLPWILTEVRSSQICLVVLTPESLGKPWLMWEAGAVTGVALGNENQTPIVPLLFRVSAEQIPGPLRDRQAHFGNTEEGIRRVLQRVHQFVQAIPAPLFDLAVQAKLPDYLAAMEKILQARPMALSEPAVQEWCERLDALREQNRYGEVGHLHVALLKVFSSDDQVPVPLDVRLHRRLGEMYLAARLAPAAVVQFELALRLVPQDLFLKHKLALAHVEAGNGGKAKELLEELERVNPDLATWNPEFAGLKGRIFRDEWKRTGSQEALRKARDAYWAVMEKQPDSYYVADNVGQLSLLLGEKDKALAAYATATSAIERLRERSVWSLATLATAGVVSGDLDAACDRLRDVALLGASPREIESIEGGLARVREALGIEQVVYERLLVALRG